MLPDSNFNKGLKIAFILMLIVGFETYAQRLVYDLSQDWVYYDFEYQGFLPLGQEDAHKNIIGFKISNKEFDQFYLNISVADKSYLFYRDKLIAVLAKGTSSFKIDSLKNSIGSNQPTLTVYGNKLLPALRTVVSTQARANGAVEHYQPDRFANSFSNFFYIALTLIVILFVILKTKFTELADQYLLFQRAFKFRTIDELIYKIEFFGYPNNIFILLLSMIFGFVTLSYMYFYPGALTILDIQPGGATLPILGLYWLEITVIVLVIFIAKYILMLMFSSMFALKTLSIHFATILRLMLYLSFLLLIMTAGQFIIIGVLPETFYWVVIVLALLAIEVILYFKITLFSKYTLLYNIIYLCATEIIPMVFLFKIILR